MRGIGLESASSQPSASVSGENVSYVVKKCACKMFDESNGPRVIHAHSFRRFSYFYKIKVV